MPDKKWMQLAYEQALKAYEQHEVPIGAVVVSHSGELLGVGYNQVIQRHDPIAHAEILAIQAACSKTHNYRLDQATIYTTLEPCSMCAGAMIQARVKRLAFAARDFKAGAGGSVYNLLKGYPLNHQVQIDEGMMIEECSSLLSGFFQQKR